MEEQRQARGNDPLSDENARLREENAKLRKMASETPAAETKKMNGCLLAVLICGGLSVVGIPVLAVMAAIALPMYSTFKQKATMGADMMVINSFLGVLLIRFTTSHHIIAHYHP